MAEQRTREVPGINDKPVKIVADTLLDTLESLNKSKRAADVAALDAGLVSQISDEDAKRAESLNRDSNLFKS